MSHRLALAAAALAMSATPAAASTTTTLKERALGPAATLVGDNDTIAAWPTPTGAEALTSDGAVRKVATPACDQLVAAGAKRLLFECSITIAIFPPPPRTYVVVHPGTGAQQQFSLTNPYTGDAAGTEPRLNRLGGQWAQARVAFHQSVATEFYNWRTGQYRKAGDVDFGAHTVPDLDAAGLKARLCAPFTRTTGSLQAVGRHVLIRGKDGNWRLGRCGSSRTTSFGRAATLARGWLVYEADGTTRLRRLRDGRTYRLRSRGTVQVVGDAAVVSRPGGLTRVALP